MIPHILVVDDNDQIRELLQEVFERQGWQVTTAEDGEEGFTSFASRIEPLSGVTLDMDMPGMGGPKCLQLMNLHNPDVPVIIISSNMEDEQRRLCPKAVAWLQKPGGVFEAVAIFDKLFKGLGHGTGNYSGND